MKKIRILSIDGGGIRGIIPGTILTYIEEALKEKSGDESASIGDYFDFVAGTSTGGMLSMLYLCPDKNNNYRYTARQALAVYLDHGGEIFDVSFWKKLWSAGGLLDKKYDVAALEETLKASFNETKLSQTLKPCFITSYDLLKRKAHFFSSISAQGSEVYDFLLRDVGRATTAAPTFFEPAQIKSMNGTSYDLVDGGMFANNPALCAYAEARTTDFSIVLKDNQKPSAPSAKDIILVSFGTGTNQKPYPYEKFKDASFLRWAHPIMDIMMSGNSETVNYQLEQIYSSLSLQHHQNYYRIQPRLINADSYMDNASPKNLKALHRDGLAAIEQYKPILDEIVDKLIANQ